MASSDTFEKFVTHFVYYTQCKKTCNMQQYSFCDETAEVFGIKLDADISIWMQSRFDGFDFSATLVAAPLSQNNLFLPH